MGQILHVVILTSQRGESGRWEGGVGLLQHSQDGRRADGDRRDRHQFGDAVIGEKLDLLQAGGGVGGGGGTGAGVECVCLGAVCQPVLLKLQVTGQGVNVMNHLETTEEESLQLQEVMEAVAGGEEPSFPAISAQHKHVIQQKMIIRNAEEVKGNGF